MKHPSLLNEIKDWLAVAPLARGMWVLLLGLLSLGQLQRWQVTPVLSLYGHDVILGMAAMWSWWQWSARRSVLLDWWQNHRWLVIMGVWTLVGWVVAALTIQPVLPAVLYAGRAVVYAVGTVWLFHQSKLHRDWWRSGYVLAGVGMLWLGVLQYVFLPDTRFLRVLGWDDHYYRLIGTLLDPNFTGLFLIMIGCYLWSVAHRWPRALLQWLTLALLVAVALTFSRASYAALAVVLMLLVFYRLVLVKYGGWRLVAKVLAVLAVAGVAWWLAPKPTGEGVNLLRQSTITARWQASLPWLTSLQPWQWLVGRGALVQPGLPAGGVNLAAADHANWPDNWLILLISSWGVVGTVGWVVWSGKRLTKLSQTDPWLVLAIAAVLTHGLFNHSLLEPFVWLLLWGGLAGWVCQPTGRVWWQRLWLKLKLDR